MYCAIYLVNYIVVYKSVDIGATSVFFIVLTSIIL